MCKAAEELVEKRAEELAEKRTVECVFEEQKDTAARMIADGELSTEKIVRYTGLPVDVVEEMVKLNK